MASDIEVVAVIVTRNRRDCLIKCIGGVLDQSVSVGRVIVIDNCSDDDTHEGLHREGFLDDPRLQYTRLEENTGGAGGFSRGLMIAFETSADWFWLMDDDVAPEPTCLENLMAYSHVSECLHPRRMLPDGSWFKWEHHVDATTLGRTPLNDISFSNGKNVAFVNAGCFEGMLVSRRVVGLVGFPDTKYFISDDDTLFGFKASCYTNVAYVASAVMKKLIAIGPPAPWKAYYTVRNKFYLRRDALHFLRVRDRRTDYALFVLGQMMDTARFFKMGYGHGFAACKGLAHGLAYRGEPKISWHQNP